MPADELTMMIEGLPQKFRVPVVQHNRTQLVFRNRSKFAYQVAGTRKNSKLGKGKGLTYLHGTEVGEWGDEEGFASLQAAMSTTHPHRMEIYESTAQGFNFFSNLWDRAQDSVSMKAVFIGWWRNEKYVCLPGSNGAVKDGWDKVISAQLDSRHGPCNMVELMPRLMER